MPTPKQIMDMRVAFAAWLQNPFTAVYLTHLGSLEREAQDDIRMAAATDPSQIPRLCGVADGIRASATGHYDALTLFEESHYASLTTGDITDDGAEYLGSRPHPDDVAGEDSGPGGDAGGDKLRPGRAYQAASRSRENRQALLALRGRGQEARD